jgi:hypothetical protein
VAHGRGPGLLQSGLVQGEPSTGSGAEGAGDDGRRGAMASGGTEGGGGATTATALLGRGENFRSVGALLRGVLGGNRSWVAEPQSFLSKLSVTSTYY